MLHCRITRGAGVVRFFSCHGVSSRSGWICACAAALALAAGTAAAHPWDGLVEGLRAALVADSTATAPRTELGSAWIEIDEPQSSEIVRLPVGWVEMQGRVGGTARGYDDVVVAIDRSQSTLLPTGLDIDGDGTTGALADPNFDPAKLEIGSFRTWTTDYDDIVLQAAIGAVHELLKGIDPERVRVGLISFSGKAKVMAPLGPVADALVALDRVPIEEDDSGSDLAAAVQQGLFLLTNRQPKSRPAQRAILLVSDGLPTQPRNEMYAARRARAAAREAKRAGVALYTFEMAHLEDSRRNDSEVLADMASASGGKWRRVDRPVGLRFELPHRSGGGAARIEIVNQTTKQSARAVRIFPNGNFDAFLPLQHGDNRFLIRAKLADGRETAVERVIAYQPPPANPNDQKKIEGLLNELKRRTRETENWRAPGPPPTPSDKSVIIVPDKDDKPEN